MKRYLYSAGAIWAAFVALAVWLSVLMVRYNLEHVFHKHVSLIAEFVLGLVLSTALPVITLVVWVLTLCGVLS